MEILRLITEENSKLITKIKVKDKFFKRRKLFYILDNKWISFY